MRDTEKVKPATFHFFTLYIVTSVKSNASMFVPNSVKNSSIDKIWGDTSF